MPASTTYTWTDSDIGCWIDGAYGSEHARDKLATMLDEIGTAEALALANELRDGDEEFWGEVFDDGVDLLSQHTAPGLTWFTECGDLVLTEESD